MSNKQICNRNILGWFFDTDTVDRIADRIAKQIHEGRGKIKTSADGLDR